jgi:hypothetical protein
MRLEIPTLLFDIINGFGYFGRRYYKNKYLKAFKSYNNFKKFIKYDEIRKKNKINFNQQKYLKYFCLKRDTDLDFHILYNHLNEEQLKQIYDDEYQMYLNSNLIKKAKKGDIVTFKTHENELENGDIFLTTSISQINTLQEKLLSDVLGVNEKNNIYEQLKYLNELQSKEAEIEEEIKKQYNINCFIKIDNSDVESVCISDKHDKKLANNIMRLAQEEFDNKMYISVKFQS